MVKKIFIAALFVCFFYSPCRAITTVEKLVDEFAGLSVLEQQKLSERMAGTNIYSSGTVTDITEPGLFDRFAGKLYYKVTSELMTSPDKRKEYKIIYCYTDSKKALAFKLGDRIKGSGTLMKIEGGVFWAAVWLEME
ncbi:MAG: hypothetical protein WC335_03815 [Candidatus Omnitrophota bacterium]|jgi:hypothetical protein